MKLKPVTKLGKRNTATSKIKKRKKTSYQQIVTPLSLFQFMSNFEQSRSWIPDAWSAILTFLLIATFFCLTKNENKTKKSLKQLSCYGFK